MNDPDLGAFEGFEADVGKDGWASIRSLAHFPIVLVTTSRRVSMLGHGKVNHIEIITAGAEIILCWQSPDIGQDLFARHIHHDRDGRTMGSRHEDRRE